MVLLTESKEKPHSLVVFILAIKLNALLGEKNLAFHNKNILSVESLAIP